MSQKRIFTLVFFLLCTPGVFAGVAYRFTTVTTGFAANRINGTVEADGGRMRVNIAGSEGTPYAGGSFVLADGNHISVCDPNTKTYYDLVVDPLGTMKSMLGDALSKSNEHSSTRTLGPNHTMTTSSYDMSVAIVDKKVTMHIAMTTESWTTDKFPPSASIAKVVSSDPYAAAGSFPLKQVTTFNIDQNGTPIQMTSTTTVSDVVTKPIPASDLTMPAGYRKVDSPIDSAMKSLGK